MAIRTSTIEVRTCDICGKEMAGPLQVGDNMHYAFLEIHFEVYYAGSKTYKDVCEKCNTRIWSLIFDLMTGKKG